MSAPEQPVFSPESRRRNLMRLRTEDLDVLILGGGINGAGIARDLVLRAGRAGMDLRVGLVEQRHFASGTSGKNSQLIHGGLRYLKQLEVGLVREALRERATLLALAPHLVEPLPFLIPMYGWPARLLYGTGLWLYDYLAGERNIGRRRFLSRDAVAKLEPGLSREGLVSAAIFFDCRVHSARFVLENIFDAAQPRGRLGALVANYARAEAVCASGARVVDVLSGDAFPVRARKVVDATGPWESGSHIRLVRGSHLVLPRLNASDNAIAHFEDAGRIVFVIPWGSSRQLSLVGTTDSDHTGGPDAVRISEAEARYLLEVVRRLFPSCGDIQPIAAFSSLRALVRSGAESPTEISREHRIWNSADGVLHVAGGKYTTYRAMSEEAADAVAREIAPPLMGQCATAETPLGGNTRERLADLRSSAAEMAGRYRLDTEQVMRLIGDYGVQAPNVLGCLPEKASQGLTRVECAQIAFAVRHEMAQQLADVLFVSTYRGYEEKWTPERLLPFAQEMGRLLGWDPQRMAEEIRLALRVSAVPTV